MKKLIIIACTKDDDTEQPTPQQSNVYVVGYEYNPTTNSDIAKIWKNGIITTLNDNGKANAVFIK